jgi:hypothetical protein
VESGTIVMVDFWTQQIDKIFFTTATYSVYSFDSKGDSALDRIHGRIYRGTKGEP